MESIICEYHELLGASFAVEFAPVTSIKSCFLGCRTSLLMAHLWRRHIYATFCCFGSGLAISLMGYFFLILHTFNIFIFQKMRYCFEGKILMGSPYKIRVWPGSSWTCEFILFLIVCLFFGFYHLLHNLSYPYHEFLKCSLHLAFEEKHM